jgi:hypothetical protein
MLRVIKKMFEIAETVSVHANARDFFLKYRDKLDHCASDIEGIESIKTLSRDRKSNGLVHIIRIWAADARIIPSWIKIVIGEEWFQYKDEAYWDERALKNWFILTPVCGSMYTIKGSFAFVENGAKETTVNMNMSIELCVSVPGYIEEFFAQQIKNNLVESMRNLCAPSQPPPPPAPPKNEYDFMDICA